MVYDSRVLWALRGNWRRNPIMTQEALKEAKKPRKNAKAALTRCDNRLTNIVEVKRSASEIRDALDNVKKRTMTW